MKWSNPTEGGKKQVKCAVLGVDTEVQGKPPSLWPDPIRVAFLKNPDKVKFLDESSESTLLTVMPILLLAVAGARDRDPIFYLQCALTDALDILKLQKNTMQELHRATNDEQARIRLLMNKEIGKSIERFRSFFTKEKMVCSDFDYEVSL